MKIMIHFEDYFIGNTVGLVWLIGEKLWQDVSSPQKRNQLQT